MNCIIINVTVTVACDLFLKIVSLVLSFQFDNNNKIKIRPPVTGYHDDDCFSPPAAEFNLQQL